MSEPRQDIVVGVDGSPAGDAALSWAAKCPGAQFGTIEVRPIWEP